MSTRSSHFPDAPTPEAKLKSLSDPNATVDLTASTKAEGHAADGSHTTKVQLDQEEQTPQAGGRTNEPHLRPPEQRFRDAIGNEDFERLKAEVPALRGAQ